MEVNLAAQYVRQLSSLRRVSVASKYLLLVSCLALVFLFLDSGAPIGKLGRLHSGPLLVCLLHIIAGVIVGSCLGKRRVFLESQAFSEATVEGIDYLGQVMADVVVFGDKRMTSGETLALLRRFVNELNYLLPVSAVPKLFGFIMQVCWHKNPDPAWIEVATLCASRIDWTGISDRHRRTLISFSKRSSHGEAILRVTGIPVLGGS